MGNFVHESGREPLLFQPYTRTVPTALNPILNLLEAHGRSHYI